jgi:hypothetical protein
MPRAFIVATLRPRACLRFNAMATHRIFRLAALTIASSFAFANALAAQSVRWENTGGSLPANSETTLRLVFTDCSPDDKKFKPPAVSGLQFGILRITATTTGNTRQLNYDFSVSISAAAGSTLTIPAFSIKSDDEQLSIPAATFAVGTAAMTKPAAKPVEKPVEKAPVEKPVEEAPVEAPAEKPVVEAPVEKPAAEAPVVEAPPATPAAPAVRGGKSSSAGGVNAAAIAGTLAAAAIALAVAALAVAAVFRRRRARAAADARRQRLIKTLHLIGADIRSGGKKLRALLFEWKRDAAVLLGLDPVALDERKLPNVRWYALWQEAANVIERRAQTLPPMWLPKATEAALKKELQKTA